MASPLMRILRPDYPRYQGVRPINIYLMRLVYGLMAVFLAMDVWTYILGHAGTWEPKEAMVWSVWAACVPSLESR